MRRGVPGRGVILAVVAVVLILGALISLRPPSNGACSGSARCLQGTVTRIVDGDTIDLGGDRVRLALVNTPEVGEPGYDEAKAFTASLCPVGTSATVDEDDGQTQGSYGRILAKVSCGGVNVNAELVASGHAVVLRQFCDESEFRAEAWTGC